MNKKLLLLIGTALCLLSGCAVLTVDVDVYKGPLANTVEVQAEQVIALVMGAKPLLVQLRDHLEVAGQPRYEVKTKGGAERLVAKDPPLQEELLRLRTNDWYWAGFFPPQAGRQLYLQDVHAIRVNEVLSLYEDRAPWDIAPLLDRGRSAYERYLGAFRLFRPESAQADKRIWDSIYRDIVKPKEKQLLVNAYSNLLVAAQAPRGGTERHSANLSNLVSTELTNQYGPHPGSNALFDDLQHGTNLQYHAEQLFGSRASDGKKVFLQRGRAIAQAYLEAREAMHELLILALEGHSLASSTNSGALKFESENTRQTVIRAAAELLAACVQPKDFKSQAQLQSAQAGTNTPSTALVAKFVGAVTNRWVRSNYVQASEIIRQEVRNSGPELSASIRSLDAVVARSGDIRLRYGIARGPTATEDDIFPSQELRRALTDLESAANSAFAGGRLQPGMETLIEHYLESARTNRWFDARSKSDEFTHLLDSLVAFGQKVVTLGNTATFLGSSSSPEVKRYVTVLQYVGNAILVHVDELKHRAHHTDRLKTTAPLTAKALQEAGFTNAIFSNETKIEQMDAKDVLEHLVESIRAQHIKTILDQPHPLTATVDVQSLSTNAATNALSLATIAAVTNVSHATTTIVTPGTTNTPPVTNQVPLVTTKVAASSTLFTNFIAVADTSKVAGVSVSLTNRVTPAPVSDKFLAAIERVVEMENNKIYLRPASAYLRSSFPASTLLNNSSVGWNNQLERQAWRSMPLIGHILDAEGSARLKELRELDKQSWQNINRVRVAGAGSVNYVIAKDDVGNWYVKQYAADPTNIIKSARNLAMFSAGNAFGKPLSILGADGQAILATNSPFSAQFTKANGIYLAQTTNTWTSLTNQLLDGTFTGGIASAWSLDGLTGTALSNLTNTAFAPGVVETYQKAVKAGATRITKAAAGDFARAVDAAILDVLYAVKRYHDSVRPRLDQGTGDPKQPRQTFTVHIRGFLDGVMAERTQALDRFDAGIEIIQGATSP